MDKTQEIEKLKKSIANPSTPVNLLPILEKKLNELQGGSKPPKKAAPKKKTSKPRKTTKANPKKKEKKPELVVYVSFRNKEKGFKPDKKFFVGDDAYEKAAEWGRSEFENFHPDFLNESTKEEMLKYASESTDIQDTRTEMLKKYPVVLESSEANNNEWIGFDSINSLHEELKKNGFTDTPKKTYLKNKVHFRGYPHYVQIDLSEMPGDFNPNSEDLYLYLLRYDSNFDWSKLNSEKTAFSKKNKKPDQKPSENSEEEYDCDDLIQKAKSAKEKRQKASEEREKKRESTKNKERLEKASELITESIEVRIEKGTVPSKSELKSLIEKTQKLLNVLKQLEKETK